MDCINESGIYMIENLVSGKKYIGQSQNISYRLKMHRCLLNNNRHYNPHLQNAWNKYGDSNFNFSVLELCNTDALNDKEIYYISLYDTYKNGYNRTLGGEGIRGYIISEESRQRMSDNHSDVSLSKNPRSKRIVLLNTREHFDCIILASKKYNIQKADISQNAKGKHYYAGTYNGERMVWVYEDEYKSMTEAEIEDKIFMAQNYQKGKNCYKAKPVICLNNGKIFDTISDAANYAGVCISTIRETCGKENRTAGNDPVTNKRLHWMLYEDYIKLNVS